MGLKYTLEELQDAVEAAGSIRKAAGELKVAESTLRGWLKKLDSKQVYGKAKTLPDLLDQHEIQLADWEPERVSMDGRGNMRASLKRKKTRTVPDIQSLAEVKPKTWPAPVSKNGRGCMLEVSLPDVHFGKFAWGKETGQDYDLDIARDSYQSVFEKLLQRSAHADIGKILIPLGNDLFQSNDWNSQTVKGTRVDSSDDRFTKVFQAVLESLVHSIDRARSIAPVDIIWVGGNHDYASSWYLSQALKQRYHKDKFLHVDDSPSPRKYVRFSNSLLGFTHGDKERIEGLPLLMASERPADFAACRVKEWHLGHYHRKRELSYVSVDEWNGIRIRILPSISATDAWHHENGFTGNRREAVAYLWDKEEGPIAEFSVGV